MMVALSAWGADPYLFSMADTCETDCGGTSLDIISLLFFCAALYIVYVIDDSSKEPLNLMAWFVQIGFIALSAMYVHNLYVAITLGTITTILLFPLCKKPIFWFFTRFIESRFTPGLILAWVPAAIITLPIAGITNSLEISILCGIIVWIMLAKKFTPSEKHKRKQDVGAERELNQKVSEIAHNLSDMSPFVPPKGVQSESIASNLMLANGITETKLVVLTIQQWEGGPWLARIYQARAAAHSFLNTSPKLIEFASEKELIDSVVQNAGAVVDALYEQSIEPLDSESNCDKFAAENTLLSRNPNLG